MKKLTLIFSLIGLVFLLGSCSKDDAEEPAPIVDTEPTDTTGTGTLTEVDVFGLGQNHVKADGLSEDKLYSTLASTFTGGLDGFDYVSIFVYGDIGHSATITLRGSELREGNFSLRKWALGGGCEENEAIVEIAVRKDGDTALLDFENTDNLALSIIKDENDFFVIKMAPIVGINRSSWQPLITEAISLHLSSNPAKIISSTNPEVYENLYSFTLDSHWNSGQASQSLTSDVMSLKFYDYDFSISSSIVSVNYTLSSEAVDIQDSYDGTVPQSVHMSYSVNWIPWPADYSLAQQIEMELKEKTIYVKYTDIQFVNPDDDSDTITLSGEWEMAR